MFACDNLCLTIKKERRKVKRVKEKRLDRSLSPRRIWFDETLSKLIWLEITRTIGRNFTVRWLEKIKKKKKEGERTKENPNERKKKKIRMVSK